MEKVIDNHATDRNGTSRVIAHAQLELDRNYRSKTIATINRNSNKEIDLFALGGTNLFSPNFLR